MFRNIFNLLVSWICLRYIACINYKSNYDYSVEKFNDLTCFIYSSEPYTIMNILMHMNCTCMKAIYIGV